VFDHADPFGWWGEGRQNEGGELMEGAVPSAALCTSERTVLDPALTDEHSLAPSV